MKITYLMNSYIFMEVYNKIKDGNVKTTEVKINSIVKYLKNEEKEKVYENIKALNLKIEEIKIENQITEDIFKGISVKQVGIHPLEAFNIEVSKNINVSLDIIEKIKSAIFICCSNISLIINKNSFDIEREIENIMKDIKKFNNDIAEDEEKVIDIMIRNDENTEEDIILSINVNKNILQGVTDDTDPDVFSDKVIEMIEELSDDINNEVTSLLADDEIIVRIVKSNGNIYFKYNPAIVNELSIEKEEIITNKSRELVEILTNI